MATAQEQMAANSAAWFTVSPAEQERLHQENIALAASINSSASYDDHTGVWSGLNSPAPSVPAVAAPAPAVKYVSTPAPNAGVSYPSANITNKVVNVMADLGSKIRSNIAWFGSAENYRAGIAGKLNAGIPLDDEATARAFAPDLFNVQRTASPIPSGSYIEKQVANAEMDASELAGGRSNTTVPSSSLAELKNAPADFDMGKTAVGATYVAGNILDSIWAIVSWGMGFVTKYAGAFVIMGLAVAGSKMFSYRGGKGGK